MGPSEERDLDTRLNHIDKLMERLLKLSTLNAELAQIAGQIRSELDAVKRLFLSTDNVNPKRV